MFAALSACYLSVHAFAPEWLDDFTPGNRQTGQPQDVQVLRAASRAVGEIRALQNNVAQIQLDLAKIKTELAGTADTAQSLAQKVSALEQRPAAVAQSEVPAPVAAAVPAAEPPNTSAPNASAPSTAASAVAEAGSLNDVQTSAALAPAPSPKIINAAPTAAAPLSGTPSAPLSLNTAQQLETGSLAEPAAIDFGPAVVKKPAKPAGLQISSAASVDGLRENWANLSSNNADTLQNMQPLYVAKGPPNNPAFDLVAGPVKSRAEAQKLCKALAARGVACKVGTFEGSAL